MATEEPQATGQGVRPNALTHMTFEEVKASAQRVLDLRGLPPYKTRYSYNEDGNGLGGYHTLECSEDEARVLSEFVQFWLPFLVQKEKVK